MRRCADDLCAKLDSVASWQHEIFAMRHVEDLSIAEICSRTQRSSDAVRSSLYRVKNLLVQAAGGAGEDAPGFRYTDVNGGGLRG